MNAKDQDSALPNPKFEYIDSTHIKLLEDFWWDAERVPAGFICDGTSIPRMLYSYIRPFGVGLRASLFHDYYYKTQQVTRTVADAHFYDRLKLIGMRTSKAWVLWAGVRTGGWSAWKKHTTELKRREERGAKTMTQQEEVDRNYAAFQKLPPDIIHDHGHKTALMQDGQIIAYFDTWYDAVCAGSLLYDDQPFSVQIVTDRGMNFRYFSHV